MRSILVLLGLVAVAFACEDGWESFRGSCYKFDNTNRNYADSETFCVEQGGHLVSIHSDDENHYVIDKARQLNLGNTWIGLDDNANENVFRYLDGTPFYRGGFTRGEPNNWQGNQDCSYFPFHGPYGWDDMRCSNNASPLCEKSGPCSEGWIARQETGNCYKWFSEQSSYEDAKAKCVENNAYLVSITTPEENTFVVDNVAIATSGNSNAPRTWIGLDDEAVEGHWTLVEGESTAFLGRFARGEPNNAGNAQNCAWFPFRHDYRWDDVSCNADRKAVCKKPDPDYIPAVAQTCEDGWESFGESCYKFDNTDRNYADSEAFCVEQGGHLVSIHSDDENYYVIDKARQLNMGNTWIGLDDNGEENVFTYLDGTPFYRGGFTRGEPNNWQGNQDCSYFPFRGTYGWDDMRCSNNASPLCEKSGPCTEGWIFIAETGNCYKWFSDEMSYESAKAKCAENNAYLVSITTAEENTFVIDRVAIATSGNENAPRTWIGLDDEADEGHWTLVEPESTAFLGRFARGEPNNAGSGQNCAWFPFRHNYRWDDVSCNANRKAVCKKPSQERLFGDLTEKTKSIVVALYNGCITTETQDDINLCEKLKDIFDELVGDTEEE